MRDFDRVFPSRRRYGTGEKKSFGRPFLSGFSILSGCVTVGSVRLRLPFVLPAQALPRGGTIISPWSELAVSKLNNAAPKAIIQIFGERSIDRELSADIGREMEEKDQEEG